MKETLEQFLKFYRENRELIAMFAGGMNGTSRTQPPAPEHREEHEKSRPLSEDGNLNILEEFLKRSAV